MPFFACWVSQSCYTWTAFPFFVLNAICVLYFCIYTYLSIFLYTCICIHTCIVVVVFGILMEFVLYATVIAGTTTNKHQHNLSNCAGIWWWWWWWPLRLLHPLSLNSSIVFCLRQRIASGWTVGAIAANSSLLLLTVGGLSRSDRQWKEEQNNAIT